MKIHWCFYTVVSILCMEFIVLMVVLDRIQNNVDHLEESKEMKGSLAIDTKRGFRRDKLGTYNSQFVQQEKDNNRLVLMKLKAKRNNVSYDRPVIYETQLEIRHKFDTSLFNSPWVVPTISCKKLFISCYSEQRLSKQRTKRQGTRIKPGEYVKMSKNCTEFKSNGNFILDSLSQEEEEFPIAYSIVVYKNTEQIFRLLRAIYRPQNYYCFHVDIKSGPEFKDSIKGIASCFDNVFLSSKSFSVVWGTFSVLAADLICMYDLLKYKKWKYFINLTGHEFPLKTNYELVKILKVYNGSNDVDANTRNFEERWRNVEAAPAGIKPFKGALQITVNRQFVQYAIYNTTATRFLRWTKRTFIPDETYFSSLNNNPHLQIPGSYKGSMDQDFCRKPFMTRFINWGTYRCSGLQRHGVCVFGIGDLPLLQSRPELFANKFFIDFQSHTLDCMEELIFNRTRDEYFKILNFDTKYYESLDFVKNKV